MVSVLYKMYYRPRNRARKKVLRAEVAARLPKMGVGVEIGVFRGHHARTLVEHARPRRLYLVDPWRTGGPAGSLWGESTQQEAMDAYFSQVGYWAYHVSASGRCDVEVLRRTSREAAREVPDGIDWVYLDGDHRYEEVIADLEAWSPKVKPGGVLFGDDWTARSWYGTQVQDAVKEFFGEDTVRVLGKPGYEQWWVRKPVVVE